MGLKIRGLSLVLGIAVLSVLASGPPPWAQAHDLLPYRGEPVLSEAQDATQRGVRAAPMPKTLPRMPPIGILISSPTVLLRSKASSIRNLS